MVDLRLIGAVLMVALAAACTSTPTGPTTAGQSPGPTAEPRQTSNFASPAITATDAATRTVAASVAPTPAPSASDGAVRMPEDADYLAEGTYFWDDRYYINASRLTFTVPAGWTAHGGRVYKDRDEPGEVRLDAWVLTHVFSDVCMRTSLIDAGTTVDEFVTAVMEQEGREASAPTDVTVGGFPAKRIELTVPADLDTASCTNGVLRYWPGPGPDLSTGDCCNPPGNTDTVYVVDVAGNRLVLIGRHFPGSSAENRAELQAVVDSIEIEP